MNMTPERKQQLDQAWLETLLQETYAADHAADDQRIAAVMQRLIEPDRSTSPPILALHSADNMRDPRSRFRNLSALAIAASLLVLAFFIGSPSNENQAYAAVVRCVQSTPGLRQYRLKMVSQRPLVRQRTREANLYFDANDRFVCEHPAWLGSGHVWIGGNANERWIVPPRGPAVTGGADLLGRWLARKEIDSPYLHMTSVLDRLSKAYTLKKLDNETLEAIDRQGDTVQCVHVQGLLKSSNASLPARIDLWADQESGIAQRLVLQWPESNRIGPRYWILDRVEPPKNLPENWFEVAGHAEGRPIRSARSSDDLDEL